MIIGSSICPSLGSMASHKWRPRWPPWLHDGRHGSKMAATTSRDDPVTRSGVCHVLNHERNGFCPEFLFSRGVEVSLYSVHWLRLVPDCALRVRKRNKVSFYVFIHHIY